MRGLALILCLVAAPAAAQDRIQELMGACFAPSGTVGQAATALSTIGWRVGGDVDRAVEARAMVIPYLSGRDEQDLRRKGLEYYRDEGLPQAAQEAALSGFLISPEGHTVMMYHTGDTLECTLAIAGGSHAAQILALLPDASKVLSDPQMTMNRHVPTPPPPGVRGAEAFFFEADRRDYTNINPPRPRDVGLIVTTRVQMQ